MKKKVLNLVFGVIFIFGFIFIGCQSKNDLDKQTVNIGVLQHGSSIPIIVAQKKGIFEKNGLSVRLKILTPSQHMPALLRGDVQILSASSFPVIFSTAQQNPEAIITYMTGGESLSGDILYGLVVSKSSKYNSLKQLVGKTIGSSSKFTIVNLRNVLGASFGDNEGRTIIREISDNSTLLEALRSGTVDAIVLDQPSLSSKEIKAEFKLIEPNFRAKYLQDPYWSGSGIADSKWVKNNPAKFSQFLKSLDEALGICKNEKDSVKEIFIDYFQLKDLDPSMIGMYVYPSANFQPPLEFLKKLSDILINNGMLKPGFSPKLLFENE